MIKQEKDISVHRSINSSNTMHLKQFIIILSYIIKNSFRRKRTVE